MVILCAIKIVGEYVTGNIDRANNKNNNDLSRYLRPAHVQRR